MPSRRVAKLVALSTEVTIRPSGLPSWSTIALRAGATASSAPVSNGPCPSRSSSTLRAPTCAARARRAATGSRPAPCRRSPRRRLGVLHDLPPGGVRAARALRVQVLARRAAPRTAARRSAPPPSGTIWNRTSATAIIGMTTITMKNSRSRLRKDGVKRLRGASGGGADRQSSRRAGSPGHGSPATIGVSRRAGQFLPPPLRGYSSVGRAPGSHPGGRGFESP